jgi:hypothetical protein
VNSPNICLFCRVVDQLVGQKKTKKKQTTIKISKRIMQIRRRRKKRKQRKKEMAQLSDQ